MQRKDFIKAAFAAAALPSFNSFPKVNIKDKIKARRLNPGDTMGLIAPGSYISENELRDCIKNIELLGLKPYYTDNILKQTGYFSGTDQERLDDLHLMFRDKNVKGIICARGGYGCARLLPLIDYDLIKSNPKVFSGYSDVTALLYGIYSQTGLVTFHGPVGISTFNEFTLQYFKELIFNGTEEIDLVSKTEDPDDLVVITTGKASGELAGGNLSILNSLLGTPYDIDLSGKILFLEEITEEPYRIDRMLTHMIQADKFKGLKGIALGVFKDCEPKKIDPAFEKSFSLIEVLFERLSRLKIPAVYGLSFGHTQNKFTLPLGISAELNTFTNTIRLSERSVE